MFWRVNMIIYVRNGVQLLYLCLLRPVIKWILHHITGQCELMRICYSQTDGYKKTSDIENSLMLSKTLTAWKTVQADDEKSVEYAMNNIMDTKRLSMSNSERFYNEMKRCLLQIKGYEKLVEDIETLRKEKYSSENEEHEQLLMQLWSALMPETPLEARITKQWTDIGFQGDNPMTDFRGMGLLGLQNLVYLAEKHNKAARRLVTRSHHPQYGYSFAVVSINITSMAYHLMLSGCMKTHLYNHVKERPLITDFHSVYAYLLYEFDKFWFNEKPRDIMEFNRIREKFHQDVLLKLKDESTVLDSNLEETAS